MAYGEKYSLEFGDDPLHGNTWKIEIHEDGYVGSSTDVIAEGKPAEISWKGGDLFEPIRSSEATINFLSVTDFQWADFFTPDEFQFLCKIKKNGSLYWEGIQMVENYSESYILPPYPVQLRFSDGLGNLKFIKFEDSGLITGTDTLLNVIIFCLEKLPYSKNIVEFTNIIEDDISAVATNNLLNTTYVDKSAFRKYNSATQQDEGMMCLDVIKSILVSTGCTIFQSDNKWHIVRIEEYEKNQPDYIEYTAGSDTISSSGQRSVLLDITNNKNTGLLWINRDAELEISDVFSEIEINYGFAPPFNDVGELIKDTMKPAMGGFDYWSRTADYSGSSYGNYHTFKTSAWPDNAYFFTKGLLENHNVSYPWNGSSYQIPLDEIGGSVTYQDLFTTTNDTSVFKIAGAVWIDNTFPRSASYNSVYELGFWMEIIIGSYKLKMTQSNALQWVTSYGSYTVPPFPRLETDFVLSDYDQIWYGEIPDEVYQIDQFTWISGTTVRVDIDNNPTFVDITNADQIRIRGANNTIHNGTFSIVTINTTYDYIDITNPSVTDATNNENNSPALGVKEGKITTVYYFDLSMEFPAFPETGVNDLIVKLYTPINPLLNEGEMYANQLKIQHISYKTMPDNNTLLNFVNSTSINTSVRDNRMQQSISLSDPAGGATSIKKSFKVKPGSDYLATDGWYKRLSPLTIKTAMQMMILDPYIKYYSEYRRKLRGTLFGEFDFWNTIRSKDLRTFFQNALTFNIKSGEYNVDLIEIKDSIHVTDITTTDVVHNHGDDWDDLTNPPPDPPGPGPGYEQEMMKTTQSKFTNQQNTASLSITNKASPIIAVNDSGSNGDNYNNYPAS
jgi:hypothetical protein